MKIVLLSLLLFALLFCILCAPAADCIDRTPVPTLDLDRFLGHWYEIARFDHRFERNLEAVETDYTLRPDGRIAVANRGVDERTGHRSAAHGKARTTRTPGRLRVSFFWFFYSDYNVLERGDDYEWLLVGSRSPKYLWILSRTPRLDVETTNRILRLARCRGYATSQLLFVDQPAADSAVAARRREVKRSRAAEVVARAEAPRPAVSGAAPVAVRQATEQGMPSASTSAAMRCSSSREIRSSVVQGVSRSSE